ncbi:MAG TPA: hypothetical protein P5121_30840 [Caldilineaceae bacterium]|nr:hypothetical protein [Caldilineaceae bacterium]
MTQHQLRTRLHRTLTTVTLVWLTAACTVPPTPTAEPTPIVQESHVLGSCALALPAETTDEEAITKVLQAEGEWVVQQEIDLLMQLWNRGATIVDAKHTEADTTDDQQWLDKDAIRHRYVRTVFPGAPAVAAPKDLAITLDGVHATVTATTQIGNEVSPGGDRWQLSKVENCWVIDRLTYNLESQQN